MRKVIAVFLVLCFACCGVGLAEHSVVVVQNPDVATDSIGVQPGTIINVGMTTAPAGYFATNLWGTNAADLSIRALLHGYSTITHTRYGTYVAGMEETGMQTDGMIIFDGMAFAGVRLEGNGVEERKYVFSLMADLVYNDGTPITAKDYIFSLLMSSSQVIAELGGTPRDISQCAGYKEYLEGKMQGLFGLRMIDELTFSLEMNPAYLPYFYGIAVLDITPYPMHVIAPGCDIVDDGEGCYISGAFTKELLEKTLLDAEDGYLFNPRVTSGPYQLESNGREDGIVRLVVNPNYIGNYEGMKPHVERLTLRKVDNESMMDTLQNGEIDLVSEVVNGDAITDGLERAGEEGAQLSTQNYPRSGLAYLALTCEQGVMEDVVVRRALAQCVDKAEIVNMVSPYSLTVDGYYGLGQWMPNYSAQNPDGEEGPVEMSEELEALNVPFDIEAAKQALNEAGWNLNEQGEAYEEGVRYRQGESGPEPLVVRWAKTKNQVTTQIREVIEPALVSAGFELIVSEMSFDEVLEYFYRQKDRSDYDMFFIASDFLEVFDPYYSYHVDEAYQGAINTSGLRSEKLMQLAEHMRRTPPAEQQIYVMRWLDFQKDWALEMPMVPLYTNVYFDFYHRDIQDYDNVRSLNWGYAVPYAWILQGSDVTEQSDEATDVTESLEENAMQDEAEDGNEVIEEA